MSAVTTPSVPSDVPASVVLPPGATFPVRVEVPAMGLLLRDQDALDDLNRLLDQIRRIPLRTPPPSAAPTENGVEPTAHPPDEPEYCPYPGFGEPDDVQARIKLLNWINAQVNVTVPAEPGDYVLGTEWRILGVGKDFNELHNRVIAAEPELASARLVAYYVTLPYW